MKYEDLYYLIDNPLDNSKVLKELCFAYSNSSDYISFYKELTSIKYDNNIVCDDNDFQVLMFNKWRDSIVNMTKERFKELYRVGQCDLDFIKLRNVLKNNCFAKTKQDIINFYNNKSNDIELNGAIKKYRWDNFGKSEHWCHVCSKYVTAYKDNYPNIEHRLYLNVLNKDIYKMASNIVLKCDKYNLPYYFKYSLEDIRDDSIVMYSSTENLIKYISILNEIKKEQPELVSRIGKPPLLTGKIDDWIGYGSEPSIQGNSFNGIRAKLIGPSIDKVVKGWVNNNKNTNIKFEDKDISVKDFIALKSTEECVKNFEGYYRLYGDDIFYREFGFRFGQLSHNSILKNIYNSINKNMNVILDVDNTSCFSIKLSDDISFSATSDIAKCAIRKFAPVLIDEDPQFYASVKKQIEDDSVNYGIDATNFCFDLARVPKLNMQPRQRYTNESDESYEKALEKHYKRIFSNKNMGKVK